MDDAGNTEVAHEQEISRSVDGPSAGSGPSLPSFSSVQVLFAPSWTGPGMPSADVSSMSVSSSNRRTQRKQRKTQFPLLSWSVDPSLSPHQLAATPAPSRGRRTLFLVSKAARKIQEQSLTPSKPREILVMIQAANPGIGQIGGRPSSAAGRFHSDHFACDLKHT